jgi:hypothetical protein
MASSGIAKEESRNPWQECGLGATVFPENTTAAALSNIIWDLGTSAVTTAISTPDWCKGQRGTAARFIHESYEKLASETAIGEGEHLSTMAELMGCSQATESELVDQLRVSMSRDLSEEGFADLPRGQKAELYFHTVEGIIQEGFADQCVS